MKLAFIGYGALGIQIMSLLHSLKTPISEVIYFDDILFKDKEEMNTYFSFEDFESYDFSGYKVFVGLGYKHLVKKRAVIDSLSERKVELLTIIHPTAYVSPSATIEQGVIIYPMCTIDNEVIIKTGTVLHNGAIISHNSILGSSVYISPGVVVSGNVSIGNCSFIGANSSISNGLILGNEVTIGVGSVVIQNIESSKFAIGNPAMLKSKLDLK